MGEEDAEVGEEVAPWRAEAGEGGTCLLVTSDAMVVVSGGESRRACAAPPPPPGPRRASSPANGAKSSRSAAKVCAGCPACSISASPSSAPWCNSAAAAPNKLALSWRIRESLPLDAAAVALLMFEALELPAPPVADEPVEPDGVAAPACGDGSDGVALTPRLCRPALPAVADEGAVGPPDDDDATGEEATADAAAAAAAAIGLVAPDGEL